MFRPTHGSVALQQMWSATFAAVFITATAYSRQKHFAQVAVKSSYEARSLVRSEITQFLPDHRSIQVRFSLLQPTNDTDGLLGTQLPFLKNSLCWSEKNLASALIGNQLFGYAPEYVVYTDNHTHNYATEVFHGFPSHRYHLVNLDMDPKDMMRMAPFNKSEFDDRNWASVRRTLADSDHLDPQKARLLLGTDVKFLQRPLEFIEAASQLHEKQAVYMVDRFWQGQTADGQPVSKVKYRMNSTGPQCPGLLGDFVYLSPGLELTVKKLQEKMTWYMNQPRVLERTIPPCSASCLASNGLHAIDQFGLMMALGEAVRPMGEGCYSLDTERYSHWYPRTPKTQVTHDKTMDTCEMVQPVEMAAAYSSEQSEDSKLKMLFAALVLLFTAMVSLLCAFTEEKGSKELQAFDDWKDMCSS